MNDVNNEKYAYAYGTDPLSELFKLLKLDVGIYHNAKVCGNWRMADKEGRGSCFHIVTLGSCHLDVPGHFSGQLDEGDLVIFATAVPHSLQPIEGQEGIQQHLSFIEGKNKPGTGLLCGDVRFLHKGSQQLFNALPPLLIIRYAQAELWLKPILEMVMAENRSSGTASKAIIDRLSELLFTYAIKFFVVDSPQSVTMLSLYGDKRLIRAVEAIHNSPEQDWTLEQLAERCMMSRTVFAERFKAVSGWTAGQYILWWRMQLAWDLLQNGGSVSQAAERVGYQSEAAFSRAFKKMFDQSPGKVRRGVKP